MWNVRRKSSRRSWNRFRGGPSRTRRSVRHFDKRTIGRWNFVILAVAGLLLVFVTAPPQLLPIPRSDVPPRDSVQGRITGPASVVDGDTLTIRGTRIRLHGIDALESAQICTNASGRPWNCGREAGRALANYIRGSDVSCAPRGRDDYGRTLAICYRGAEDLNAWMVSEGWAVAYRRYSSAYVDEERTSRAVRRNIWDGHFERPEDWRRSHRGV